MKKVIGIVLIVIGSLSVIAVLVGAGFFFGRWTENRMSSSSPYGMMGWNDNRFSSYRSSGMMDWNSNRRGSSMMDQSCGASETCPFAGSTSNASTAVLSVEQARQAAEDYLVRYNDDDLEISEIMVFDQNAYVRISEKSTGIGAMEVLVDPATLAVTPEYDPNMMWNLKYGHMAGGMMGRGGMMGAYTGDYTASDEMTVTEEQALQAAQEYLDQAFPGSVVADEAEPFYGYYTIDILKDGQPTGMLSVNGFSGQVFYHSWHGNFIEMDE